MKLNKITSINYNINEELYEMAADRIVYELSEDVASNVASWYILNESTNQYEINELLVNEGIKDILSKGMGKVNDAITKGYSDLDAIKTKVVQGLKGKGDPGIMSKLGEIAKKNSKYIKPAMMVAVVGASLLGMDTASASEALNQIDQMGGQEFQQYADQMQQQFGDFKGGDAGAGGADAGAGGQAPQEDQPTQYDAGSGQGVDMEGVNALKTNIAREFVDSTLPNGQTIPKDAVLKALQSGKFDGMSLDQYLQKAMQFAQKQGMGPEQLLKVINPEIQQGMMDALTGKV